MNHLLVRLIKLINPVFSEDLLKKHGVDELRRISLVNYIGVIAILNMLTYILIYLILDFNLFLHAILFLIFSCLFTVSIIFVNIRNHFLLAKVLLSLFIPVFMSYIIFIFGKGPGFQVYLLLSTFIPLFLWSIKQFQFPVIIISLIILDYLFVELYPINFHVKIDLPLAYENGFRQTNILVCFIAAAFAIGMYQYLYRKQEEQIIRQSEELKNMQKHKDIVYSIIAHDLRSPFGAFIGFTEMFINEYDNYNDKKKIEILKSILLTSISLQNLLENLLDWSKFQSSKIEKIITNLNLKKLVKNSAALHKELILKKEQIFNVDISDDIQINADHHMISTVLRNLISNAVKFTPEKGSIKISALLEKSNVVIKIKDSGIGLSKDEIVCLFDIQKVENIGHLNAEKGSGLGLLLCKDFIECHNGKLWVQSEPGKGSEFIFTLPVIN